MGTNGWVLRVTVGWPRAVRPAARAWRLACIVPLLVWLAACAAQPAPSTPPDIDVQRHTVFVTANGWHSGIVITRADLPAGRIPEAADFPGARLVEFGWGDAEFYPAKETTIGMTLRAALVPTPAVVHVAGLAAAPVHRGAKAEVVRLGLDEAGLRRLVDFIDSSFDRGGRARVAASGPGLYAASRFYPATGRFHLLNTCNTWTARALRTAGFAGIDAGTTRAEGLMRQVRRLGRRP